MPSPALHKGLHSRALPAGILVADVADLSRLALAAFLRLDAGGGARPELALWLFGLYLDAVSAGRASLAGPEPSLVVDDVATEASAAAAIAKATHAIEGVLGYSEGPMIHADDLALA